MGFTILYYTYKNDKIVHFLSDFWEVNKKVVRKLFPIQKISTVLQEIKGMQPP
jgi:hypothetical protein